MKKTKINLNNVGGGTDLDNVYARPIELDNNMVNKEQDHDFSKWDKILFNSNK